ncbi:hypothetical protein Droror1_Dr00023845 [Drosera rotundifolia]
MLRDPNIETQGSIKVAEIIDIDLIPAMIRTHLLSIQSEWKKTTLLHQVAVNCIFPLFSPSSTTVKLPLPRRLLICNVTDFQNVAGGGLDLRRNGHFGGQDKRCDTIDYIPGIQAIDPKDVMSYLQPTCPDIFSVVHRIIYKAFKQ